MRILATFYSELMAQKKETDKEYFYPNGDNTWRCFGSFKNEQSAIDCISSPFLFPDSEGFQLKILGSREKVEGMNLFKEGSAPRFDKEYLAYLKKAFKEEDRDTVNELFDLVNTTKLAKYSAEINSGGSEGGQMLSGRINLDQSIVVINEISSGSSNVFTLIDATSKKVICDTFSLDYAKKFTYLFELAGLEPWIRDLSLALEKERLFSNV